jgi:hypothetical protein
LDIGWSILIRRGDSLDHTGSVRIAKVVIS